MSMYDVLTISSQYIEVNPYNKPKELLDLNPRGLVPTFQYGQLMRLHNFMNESIDEYKQMANHCSRVP